MSKNCRLVSICARLNRKNFHSRLEVEKVTLKSMGFHATIELNVVDHSLVLVAREREGVANCNTSLACN